MPRGMTTDTLGRAGCGLAFDFAAALILVGLGGREALAFWAGAFLDFTTATEESFERYVLQACAFPERPLNLCITARNSSSVYGRIVRRRGRGCVCPACISL